MIGLTSSDLVMTIFACAIKTKSSSSNDRCQRDLGCLHVHERDVSCKSKLQPRRVRAQ